MKTKFSVPNSHSIFQILNSRFFSSRSVRKGFTLLELLVYAGVLAVSATLIGGIVYTVSKAGLRTQIGEEIDGQMARLEEIFRQKIGNSRGINSVASASLSLEMADADKNPTVFTYANNILYLQEGIASQAPLNDANKIKITSLSFSLTGASEAAISSQNHYAWNDQVGWIDFAYPGGNVLVPTGAGDLKGGAYVLSDKHWISFNCALTDSCATVNYKVSSDANGNLSGWAWSDNFGWISFNCATGGADGGNICSSSDYKVAVATSTGEFNGYAWSENIGWISFNCKTGGATQNDICSTSQYRVDDLRLKTSAIKIDLTLQYNSLKPELMITRSRSFVFNTIAPDISVLSTTTTTSLRYCDNDKDGYFAAVSSSSCTGLSSSTPGDDCDDNCSTCYVGSTVCLASTDGKDQNCNGVIDETNILIIANYGGNSCTTVCANNSFVCLSVGTDADGTDYNYRRNVIGFPPDYDPRCGYISSQSCSTSVLCAACEPLPCTNCRCGSCYK